jgi:hypothetical protein
MATRTNHSDITTLPYFRIRTFWSRQICTSSRAIMRFTNSNFIYSIGFTAILAYFLNLTTLPMRCFFSRFMQIFERHNIYLKGAPRTEVGLLFRQSGPIGAHKIKLPTYQTA